MITRIFRNIVLTAGLGLAPATTAHAIVGGGVPSADGIGRNVVTIVGSRGNFCSGTMIAPSIVLTAAHCVQSGATYKIVEYDAQRTPQLRDIAQIAAHPQFNLQTMLAHRATADVALLRLASPLAAARQPPPIGTPRVPITVGGRFTVAGIGVTLRGDGKSGGVVRAASLAATGKPGNLQIRLVDPLADGKREGLGACTGDSGGPVFEDQQGRAILIGVMSWSTGPNGTAGCGGMTGVTPLSLYRDWILQTARGWGAAL
ncbi:trypsin-like serine protease [Bradyrhizobium sp. LHD-71]|uniref:S1 family peptidase n=1 Tax=Bradyrhizobium sp. LHD-71 TaxID=3072141 RepID=UPI0028108467|nr:trypsin-like serine protease [Bradyrhizobium sp. LHD-71]MDQ8728572.1 trypsin-like serine protease [Bradyrhizobium sp. LHD-71]